MRFFIGLHIVYQAWRFDECFISINQIRNRRSEFGVKDWILDSGAFTEIMKHGGYRYPPSTYAREIRYWADNGNLLAAVAQDYMCESQALQSTGLSVTAHQALTIGRYDALLDEDLDGVTIIPVLQGQSVSDYMRHLDAYGTRLKRRAWVGVGSICKRRDVSEVRAILQAIKAARPDLRLHGFGLKYNAFMDPEIVCNLHSADSMAWSFAARYEGRDRNGWQEAMNWRDKLNEVIERTRA